MGAKNRLFIRIIESLSYISFIDLYANYSISVTIQKHFPAILQMDYFERCLI